MWGLRNLRGKEEGKRKIFTKWDPARNANKFTRWMKSCETWHEGEVGKVKTPTSNMMQPTRSLRSWPHVFYSYLRKKKKKKNSSIDKPHAIFCSPAPQLLPFSFKINKIKVWIFQIYLGSNFLCKGGDGGMRSVIATLALIFRPDKEIFLFALIQQFHIGRV